MAAHSWQLTEQQHTKNDHYNHKIDPSYAITQFDQNLCYLGDIWRKMDQFAVRESSLIQKLMLCNILVSTSTLLNSRTQVCPIAQPGCFCLNRVTWRYKIRIFTSCEMQIENSVTRISVQHHKACQVKPEWPSFQFAPNNHYRFFFLNTFPSINWHQKGTLTSCTRVILHPLV